MSSHMGDHLASEKDRKPAAEEPRTMPHSYSTSSKTSSLSSTTSASTSTSASSQMTSPSKSIKNYFKNRTSLKSIDTISEAPEAELSRDSPKPPLSPLKGAQAFLLPIRPTFTRSRSSLASIHSGAGTGALAAVGGGTEAFSVALSPKRTPMTKPVEIDDFADSDSGDDDYDGGNSIIDQYSDHANEDNRNSSFLFKEDLEESFEKHETTFVAKERKQERERAINQLTSQSNTPVVAANPRFTSPAPVAALVAPHLFSAANENKENISASSSKSKSTKSSDRNLDRSSSLGNRSLDARSSILSESSLAKVDKHARKSRSSIIDTSLGGINLQRTTSTSSNFYYDAKDRQASSSEGHSSDNGHSSSQSFQIYDESENFDASVRAATKVTMKSYRDRGNHRKASNGLDIDRASSIFNASTVSGFDTVDDIDDAVNTTITKNSFRGEDEESSDDNATTIGKPLSGIHRADTITTKRINSNPLGEPVVRMVPARLAIPHSQTSSIYMPVSSHYDNDRLEGPLRSHVLSESFRSDEVALNNFSNISSNRTDEFSLSSGELLNTLQGYDETKSGTNLQRGSWLQEKPQLTSLLNTFNPDLVHGSVAKKIEVTHSTDSPVRRLVQTLGVRSSSDSTKLDKLFDPQIRTPQKAASRLGSGGSGGQSGGVSRPDSEAMSHDTKFTEYMNKNLSAGIDPFRHSNPRELASGSLSRDSFASIQPPSPVEHFRDSIARETSHERMLASTNDPFADTILTYPNPKDLEKKAGMYGAAVATEKVLAFDSYSWGRWVAYMVCGLIIPPVFFLLALGTFDSRINPSSCYTQYYYTGEQVVFKGRRFLRSQKALSVLVGLLWCLVVFAMIGVGFGIGLRNEHKHNF